MRMIIKTLLLVMAVIAIAYLCFYLARTFCSTPTQQKLDNQVCIGDRCLFVELAKTEVEHSKGLMNRTELGKNNGMLFIFDKEGVYPFWMKNTLIPLDIIWIDGSNKIVFIGQDIQPCKNLICSSVNPSVKAKYVLEVNSGLCKENNIKIGDEVKIKID